MRTLLPALGDAAVPAHSTLATARSQAEQRPPQDHSQRVVSHLDSVEKALDRIEELSA